MVVDRFILNQLIIAVCEQIGPVRAKDRPMTPPQIMIHCQISVTTETSNSSPESMTSSPMVTVRRTPYRLSRKPVNG